MAMHQAKRGFGSQMSVTESVSHRHTISCRSLVPRKSSYSQAATSLSLSVLACSSKLVHKAAMGLLQSIVLLTKSRSAETLCLVQSPSSSCSAQFVCQVTWVDIYCLSLAVFVILLLCEVNEWSSYLLHFQVQSWCHFVASTAFSPSSDITVDN